MTELIMQMEEEGFFDKYFPFGSDLAIDGLTTAPPSPQAEEDGPRKWQRKGEVGRFAAPGTRALADNGRETTTTGNANGKPPVGMLMRRPRASTGMNWSLS